jgi:addiction module HigA family antidote
MAKQTVLVPGIVIKDLLDKYGIPVSKLSSDIGLSPSGVRQLLKGNLKISLEIALKLEKYFSKPVKYWLDLQNAYALSEVAKDAKLQDELKKIPVAQKAPPAPKKAAKPAGKKGPAPKAADKKPAGKKTAGRKPAADKKAAAPKAAKAPKTAARKPRTAKKPETF